jgi:hypothetical protein
MTPGDAAGGGAVVASVSLSFWLLCFPALLPALVDVCFVVPSVQVLSRTLSLRTGAVTTAMRFSSISLCLALKSLLYSSR